MRYEKLRRIIYFSSNTIINVNAVLHLSFLILTKWNDHPQKYKQFARERGHRYIFIKRTRCKETHNRPWRLADLALLGHSPPSSSSAPGARSGCGMQSPGRSLLPPPSRDEATLKYLSEGISVTNKKRKEFQHYPRKSFLFHVLVIFVPALQCTVCEVWLRHSLTISGPACLEWFKLVKFWFYKLRWAQTFIRTLWQFSQMTSLKVTLFPNSPQLSNSDLKSL